MLGWDEITAILRRHDIVLDRPVAAPYEGLIIGNADIGATIFGPPEKLTFRLGKMDLWDARWNVEHYTQPLPLSRLKEFVYEQSRGLERHQSIPMEQNDSWQGQGRVYPCMRMGADLLVRVAQVVAGYPLTMTQRLCLADGSYEADFALGWWRPFPTIQCRAFASWQRNVLVLRFSFSNRYLGRNLVVGVWRDPWGGRDWGTLSALGSLRDETGETSWRDPRKDALPPSELAIHENSASLWQEIPGDADCPARGFAVTACCAEGAPFIQEASGQAVVEARGQDSLTLFVGMASEFEGAGSRERAARLAQQAAQDGYEAVYQQHAAAWQEYWSQSALELEDQRLEREWVHSIYALGINARSQRPAPPLFGVSTTMDCPPWQGDRHNNWPEYSNRFWGAFGANHEAQALNYTEFVYNYLPTAQRIAREVYEVERGAAYPHCYIDGSNQYYFHYVWGYSLYVTAVHAQNCWWHYQYFGDRAFLRDMAFPVMRECANLFVELVKKNPPRDYTLWPTITAEIRGWTRDFELNANSIEDLAYIKFLLRAALEAADILGVQENCAAWKELLDNLAAYPTLVLDGREEFVDVAGLSERPHYNSSVPLAPLWPGEDPDIFQDAHLHQIAINTVNVGGWQDGPREAMSLLHLGFRDKLWEHLPRYLEQISPWLALKLCHHGYWSLLINEMLLTSWDGTLRLFTGWPLDKAARFRNLRAKGAFLVSAACANGAVTELRIFSERGNPLCVQSPWPQAIVVDQTTGEKVPCVQEGPLLRLGTRPGQLCFFAPDGAVRPNNG